MNSIKSLLSAFLGQRNTVPVRVPILKFFGGNYEVAAMFEQLYYWSDRTADPDGWIFKTYDDWYDEICLTRSKLTSAKKYLVERGYLETCVRRVSGLAISHYRLNMEQFSIDFEPFLNAEEEKIKTLKKAKKEKITECKKHANRNAENLQTGMQETCKPECRKPAIPIQNTKLTNIAYIQTDHGGKSEKTPPEKQEPRKKSRAEIFRSYKPETTEEAKEVLAELSRLTGTVYSPKDSNLFEPVYFTIRQGYCKQDLLTMIRFIARDKFKRKALNIKLFAKFNQSRLSEYIAQAKASTQRSCDSQISMESLAANAALVVSD